MSAKERSRVFDGDQEGGQRNSVGEDGGGTLADGGPGLAYMPFVVMEDLLDKLKLLNYEEVKYTQNLMYQIKCSICRSLYHNK